MPMLCYVWTDRGGVFPFSNLTSREWQEKQRHFRKGKYMMIWSKCFAYYLMFVIFVYSYIYVVFRDFILFYFVISTSHVFSYVPLLHGSYQQVATIVLTGIFIYWLYVLHIIWWLAFSYIYVVFWLFFFGNVNISMFSPIMSLSMPLLRGSY